METKECYVDLHPVAKDRVMARTKASLAYLANVIETARLNAEGTLYNEFGLTKNDVEVHIGWEGDLDKDDLPFGAVVSVDFGIYNKEATQKFVGKIRNLSIYPIRDGVIETLTEINAVCVNDRVFSDVDTDAKIRNDDFFEAGMWARDALYVDSTSSNFFRKRTGTSPWTLIWLGRTTSIGRTGRTSTEQEWRT